MGVSAYWRAKHDARPDAEILAEGAERVARVRGRGVFVAAGHGEKPWDMDPALDRQVRVLYEDAKACIRAPLPAGFAAAIAAAVPVATRSHDRDDYILHPPTGEMLDEPSLARVAALRDLQRGVYDVQVIVSDGLNAFASLGSSAVSAMLLITLVWL
jgi:ethanolamine ammonia-lyase large subunit